MSNFSLVHPHAHALLVLTLNLELMMMLVVKHKFARTHLRVGALGINNMALR